MRAEKRRLRGACACRNLGRHPTAGSPSPFCRCSRCLGSCTAQLRHADGIHSAPLTLEMSKATRRPLWYLSRVGDTSCFLKTLEAAFKHWGTTVGHHSTHTHCAAHPQGRPRLTQPSAHHENRRSSVPAALSCSTLCRSLQHQERGRQRWLSCVNVWAEQASIVVCQVRHACLHAAPCTLSSESPAGPPATAAC